MLSIRTCNMHLLAGLAALSLALCTAGPVAAQFATGFEASEGYQAAPDGSVPVTGQNGWINPDPTSSDDQNVYTYDGNVLNVPRYDTGGDQFMGAKHLGDGNFPRAEHPIDVSAGGVWTIAFDMYPSHDGLHYKNNLGSISLRDGSTSDANTYFLWAFIWQKNLPSGIAWRNFVEFYDSTGIGPTSPQFFSKDFKRLPINTWYRASLTIDFTQNQVTQLSLTNLSTGVTLSFTPTRVPWYLYGGAGGGSTPTILRFFVGGGTGTDPNNIMAYDNLSVTPGGAAPVGGKVIHVEDKGGRFVDKDFGVTH